MEEKQIRTTKNEIELYTIQCGLNMSHEVKESETCAGSDLWSFNGKLSSLRPAVASKNTTQ